jgi:hypothetical protein
MQPNAQLEVLMNNMLMRLERLERRIEALERWCERHEYQGHG